MANPFDLVKMARNYQKTQNKLKALKCAGISKDETVGILIDGTMSIVEIEVEEELKSLSTDKIAHNFMEAYKAAKKELESQLRSQTSADDIKEMLGMAA